MKTKWISVALMLSAVFTLCARAQFTVTNYVASAPAGSDANGGTGWDDAWATISNAVAQAASGELVLVSNGLYNITAQITVDKTLTVRGFSDDPADTVVTAGGAPVTCFFLTNGHAVVESLTISNGLRGVYMSHTGTVVNCILVGHAGDYGVAIQTYHGGVVERCIVRNNFSKYLSAIYLDSGGTVRNTLIHHNTVSGSSSDSLGAGVKFRYGPSLVENCTIVYNTAGLKAGGVYFVGGGGSVRNSIIMFNEAPVNPNWLGGVFTHTCTAPLPAGVGNTSIAPYLVDVDAGDYRLLPGSSGLDSGTNQVWMAGAVDLDANPRVNGIVDMGAYERYPGALDCTFTADPRAGFSPQDVVLTAYVDGTNLMGMHYYWDLDNDGHYDVDGAGKTVLTNTYASAGTYGVSLLVSNAVGESDTYTRAGYLVFAPSVTYAARSGGNSDTFPYDSWATAASNIQDAVAAGVDGTLVLVSNGVYTLSSTIVVNKGMTVRSVNGQTTTLVDGNHAVPCFALSHADARVDGFTITNGYHASNAYAGGANVTPGSLQNCLIIGNSGYYGGVYVGIGGLAQNCAIVRNAGGRWGVGGAVLAGGGILRNSLIAGNQKGSAGGGGGVYISNGGTVDGCTIVYNYDGDTEGKDSAGGLYTYGGGAVVRNTILYFNEGDGGNWASTHGLQGENNCTTPLLGTGGTSADPLFLINGSGSGVAFTDGNYRLQDASLCRDNGIIQAWMSGAFDLLGADRIFGVSVDIGAYEWHPPAGTVVIIR